MSEQALFYLRGKPNPKNDPAHWLDGFEIKQEAAERYAERGRLMFTENTMSQPNFYGCKPKCPCNSGACPKCMREFRRWFVDAGITLLGQQSGPLCAANLIHRTLSRPPGALQEFDLSKAKRQLAQHVRTPNRTRNGGRSGMFWGHGQASRS